MAPPFNRFMLPLLRAISDGQEHTTPSIISAVSDDLGLSEEQRDEIMPSKRKARTTYVADRLSWAKTYLKRAGLLEMPNRGYAKITQKGLDVLKDPPDEISRKYLQRFESYREWKGTFKRRGDNTSEENEPDVDTGETPNDTMQRGFDEYRQDLHSELLEEVLKIPPHSFEKLALDLLERMYGGKAEQTQRSRDGGFDGIVYEDELGLSKIYTQCKRYDRGNLVRPKDIDAFIGVLDASSKKGIFITTSEFTPDAKERLKNRNDVSVVLINGLRLAELMEKHGVGVSEEYSIAINKIDQDYFEQYKDG